MENIRILVVDDDKEIANVLDKLLKENIELVKLLVLP